MDHWRTLRKTSGLLAAWLLLWILAMAGQPIASLPPVLASVTPGADTHGAHRALAAGGDDVHDAHDAHGAVDPHHAHGGEAGHAGHGAGSGGHCPLCLHTAAPPCAPAASPVGFPARIHATPEPRERRVHVRSAAPPPGRGPPWVS